MDLLLPIRYTFFILVDLQISHEVQVVPLYEFHQPKEFYEMGFLGAQGNLLWWASRTAWSVAPPALGCASDDARGGS